MHASAHAGLAGPGVRVGQGTLGAVAGELKEVADEPDERSCCKITRTGELCIREVWRVEADALLSGFEI